MNIKDWKKYFPTGSKPREQQKEIINFVLDKFINGNKKFIIVEAGTGCGKSHVAITVAKYFNDKLKESSKYKKGTWLLTTQKILQNQYLKDFGPPKGELSSVKSSSNYKCEFFKQNRCSDSQLLIKEADPDSLFYKACSYRCKYKVSKKNFLQSEISVTNFPYFLTESSYVKKIEPRQLLVIDEGHTIEDELSKFIEVVVSEKFAKVILEIKTPDIKDQYQAYLWIRNEYLMALESNINEINKEIKEIQKRGEEDTAEAKRLTTNIDKLTKHKSKIDKFILLYDKENWVFNLIPAFQNSGRRLEFKPIDVGEYSDECLYRFGEKVLILSATILNKEAYCESIGIDIDKVEFLSVDSPFSTDNAPVIYLPVGDMSAQKIDDTLPDMAKTIEAILEQHPNEKGVIHTRTFKIANFLMKNIKNKRLITHESHNREDIINQYIKDKKPLVLVSPSSTEGLDLKDDLSRFQIICKLHWPYLGDELVQKRMEKYDYWYQYQAVKSIIQARGRSIRTKDDYAVTYILDNAFERLYSKNIKMFPTYFRKSLHFD